MLMIYVGITNDRSPSFPFLLISLWQDEATPYEQSSLLRTVTCGVLSRGATTGRLVGALASPALVDGARMHFSSNGYSKKLEQGIL